MAYTERPWNDLAGAMNPVLYYVHDPMCSWCYAFRPTWQRVCENLPEGMELRRLLGGLAPDTEAPMPMAMRETLQATWQRIESVVPGTWFNYEFWTRCQPRRMTYRACRAVLAARAQGLEYELPMNEAIQDAYYRQARNPADPDTLGELAAELGLDGERFAAELDASETRHALQVEIDLARHIGADSFPSVVLVLDDEPHHVALDYNRADIMLARIQATLEEEGAA